MKHSIKITIQYQNYEWIKEVQSFEHGLVLARNLYEKFGLIGRAYITSSCGKQCSII